MTALAAHAPTLRLNWPRIGALSGTMSLHFYLLLLLLAPPVAYQALKRVDPNNLVVDVIFPEKKIEVKVPDPPQPIHKVQHAPPPPRVERVVPAAPEVITEATPMSTVTSDPGPPAPAHTAPIDVAPSAVAYGAGGRKVSYPIESVRRGEHGTVLLRVLVGTDGLPQQVEIERSSGYPRLDNAARDAVRHWTFRAGSRNGVAQNAWALVPVAFDLTQL